MYLDGHFHIWSLTRGDYRWLSPALSALYRDFDVEDWHREFAPLGVGAGVLVQAAPTEAETAFLLERAANAPERVAGVVGWADFSDEQAPERIDELAAHSKLVGLRPMLQDLPDADWIVQPFAERALDAMTDAGLTFDALIRPAHLPYIIEVAGRHPSLTIVVDHAAKPDIASRRDRETWAKALAELAGRPGVYCKLSGLWTEAAEGAAVQSVEPWASQVLDIFGGDRVIWGSDWPVVRCAGQGRAWFEYALGLVSARAEDARERIFGANARAAYRLDARADRPDDSVS